MNHPLLWLIVLMVVGLAIAGIVFLNSAASSHPGVQDASRTPALVGGITCLVIATGLLMLGLFMFRQKQ